MHHMKNLMSLPFGTLFAAAIAVVGCTATVPTNGDANTGPSSMPPAVPADAATAIFAGGCFWCMEEPFDEMAGVISTTSGYTGGLVNNPTYELVVGGGTGHIEAVQVVYDPARVTYAQLLQTYWKQVDPFDGAGQFCDKGGTYVARIFAATPEQSVEAQASRVTIEERFPGQSIEVKVVPAKTFWPAEGYHQDYYQKNPIRYGYYRNGCGRDARLRAVWGN
jgi:peptide-methionine (S)-S-oxide reductase